MPEGKPPAAGWPGVVVLHGSTGLFDENKDGSCTQRTNEQFEHWENMLTEAGYAVIMPASFYSRGFCDSTHSVTVPREYDDRERLVTRTFDASAAADWLCDDQRVDCSRLAAVGFSNGASTTLMLMQGDMSVTGDERLRELAPMSMVGAAAYYPGCGLEDLVTNDLFSGVSDRYYYPQAPVFVPHGSRDKLLDDCEGIRDPQVDAMAEARGVNTDMFELEVYDGAKHGFDNADLGEDRQADIDARDAAREAVFSRLEQWFD
nr:dienelactone hydrolase family protein [Pseudenhygromyxa sp. WMMC2535]